MGDGKVIHFTRGSSSEPNIATGNKLFDQILLATSQTSSHHHSPAEPDHSCRACGHRRAPSGAVVSTCLDCFLRGGSLYLFEYGGGAGFFVAKARGGTCSLAASDPAEDVLHRASQLLLRKGGFGAYDLFENNCEDFAVYCKTGLLVEFTGIGTGQAATTLLLAASAAVSSPLQLMTAASFTGLAAVGFGFLYCVTRLVSDVGVRCDVARVPVEMLVPRLDHNNSTLDQHY